MAAISYTNGVSLVPQPVANQIIQEVTQTSAALRLFKRVNMSSKTLKTPVQNALVEAGWISEGGVKPTSNVTWGDQTVTAEELAVIVPVADNLIADSAFDVWSEVRASIVAAFARKIDSATIFGTNRPSSFPSSLVEGAVASGNIVEAGHTAAQGGAGQDVLDTMRLVAVDGYSVTGFVASDLYNYDLLSSRDANGNPLLGTNATVDTLYGRSVAYIGQNVFVPGTDHALLIAGDFNQAVIGLRQDITFTMSKDATIGGVSMFETDQTAIRAVMRVGYTVFKPINAGNSGKANRFPFAVLVSSEA